MFLSSRDLSFKKVDIHACLDRTRSPVRAMRRTTDVVPSQHDTLQLWPRGPGTGRVAPGQLRRGNIADYQQSGGNDRRRLRLPAWIGVWDQGWRMEQPQLGATFSWSF